MALGFFYPIFIVKAQRGASGRALLSTRVTQQPYEKLDAVIRSRVDFLKTSMSKNRIYALHGDRCADSEDHNTFLSFVATGRHVKHVSMIPLEQVADFYSLVLWHMESACLC